MLNRVARFVIDAQRWQCPEYVLCCRSKRVGRMHSSAWKRDGRYSKGPHNLRHTFGRRLKAAVEKLADIESGKTPPVTLPRKNVIVSR